ncbi:MAG TPA: ATP-binding protein [Clostridia bacterium]|jgi:hypothetical protein|nr:ATP-binding protein [Clostridia bacterium]
MDNVYLNRLAEGKFQTIANMFPVALVCGPRQVGKTTMLKHLAKDENRTYVSLDNLEPRTLAVNDPKLFFQRYKTPILIDEIQYAPNLFSYIKVMADNNKKAGEFWLTGSQSYSIMRNVTESLAGRIGIMNMYSLTHSEIKGSLLDAPIDFSFDNLTNSRANSPKLDLQEVFKYIYFGGMPKLINASEKERDSYFSSYIHSYLMRDIMELGKISDIVKFNLFLSACALQVGNVVNYANLANVAGISQPTAKEWLDMLQGMGIVYLIRPYFNNSLKRLTKTPKLYFYDTGLCSYISRVPSAGNLQLSYMAGAYFENYVMNQLVIKYDLMYNAPQIYFYRDSDKNEIDILLEDFNGFTPLEIKMSANPNKRVVSRFKVIEKLGKQVKNGGIICLIDDIYPIDEKNSLIPVSVL